MFRTGRIYDDILPMNREVIAQVWEILRTQFRSLWEGDFEGMKQFDVRAFPQA